MMREDVATRLDELKKALLDFAIAFNPERDSDINYGEFLKDLLIHTASNYEKLKKTLVSIPQIKYKSLYVFLPGNVPMVFFEVLPLSVIFNVKTFFKYPHNEKRLYDTFISHITAKYPLYSAFFKGQYMEHLQAERKIKEYDFVFFFGSEKLIPLLKRIDKPFKFFGPGFSIGVAFTHVKEDLIKDVLYFDQNGCLSMKFLFYMNDNIKNDVANIFKKLSCTILPSSNFSQDRFRYNLLTASSFANLIFHNEHSAILEIEEERLNDSVPLPGRTLILKKIKKEEDVIAFLKGKITYLQAIATDTPSDIKILKNYASFVTEFGQLQYQPYNFFFKKGVTLKNIFKEDNHDYQMAEDI